MDMTNEMIDRIDEMDNAVYQMCLVFLHLNYADDADTKFPWDISIIGEIYDDAVRILRKNHYKICDPCMIEQEDGGRIYCDTSECGFKECKLHP